MGRLIWAYVTKWGRGIRRNSVKEFWMYKDQNWIQNWCIKMNLFLAALACDVSCILTAAWVPNTNVCFDIYCRWRHTVNTKEHGLKTHTCSDLRLLHHVPRWFHCAYKVLCRNISFNYGKQNIFLFQHGNKKLACLWMSLCYSDWFLKLVFELLMCLTKKNHEDWILV